MAKKNPLIASEFQEQCAFIEWAKIQRVETFISDEDDVYIPGFLSEYLVAIPNGGSRNKLEAKNFKKSGVSKGFPDLFLFIPYGGYHGLAIEMKRREEYKVSDEQILWIDKLNRLGYMAILCEGLEKAIKAVDNYFGFIDLG